MIAYAGSNPNAWVGVVASLVCAVVCAATPLRRLRISDVRRARRTKWGTVAGFLVLAAIWFLLR